MRVDDIDTGDKLIPINTRLRGVPVEVIEVCLPFLAGRLFDGEAVVIDTRTTDFTRCSDAFWKATQKLNRDETTEKPKKKKLDPRVCPNCGTRYIERLQQGVWLVVCPTCGSQPSGIRR